MEPNQEYPPEQFIPERFLDKECPTMSPYTWAFGFGRRCGTQLSRAGLEADPCRRICPGKALAEESLFVLIANLLATLDISAPPGGLKYGFESRVSW